MKPVSPSQESQHSVLVPLLLTLGALGLRLSIAWQPIPQLLQRNLPDDAFYYFVIAYQAHKGYGLSFDGLTLTNGFHPLWLILLIPLFAHYPIGSDLPIHLALTLGAIFDALTVLLLYYITREITAYTPAGTAAALLYAINILPLLQSTNGLETALGGFLAAVVWWKTLSLSRAPTVSNSIQWGILVGFMGLARTDLIVLAATLGGYLFLSLRTKRKLRLLLLSSLVSLSVMLPWLIWNLITFGTIVQSSAIAIPFAAYQRYQLSHGNSWLNWLHASVMEMLHAVGWLRGDFLGGPPFVSALWWLAIGAGLLWAKVNRQRTMPWLKDWLPVVIASGLLIFVHTFIRWYPRPWYFLLSAQALSVGVGGILSATQEAKPHWQKSRALIFMALLFLSLMSGYGVWRVGLYPWQEQMRETAFWISSHLPNEARIGSFNAGLYGYYSRHTVVNLDGVVNPKALEAIQHRRLLAYMVEEDISYLVDYDHMLCQEYAPFMGEGYPHSLLWIADTTHESYPVLGKIRAYRILIRTQKDPATDVLHCPHP